jgi:hypothetical protein
MGKCCTIQMWKALRDLPRKTLGCNHCFYKVFSRVWILMRYTIYTNVCGHHFKWVHLAISATLIADRCIESSTQPCNLQRQILAVEWPFWRPQWLSKWHRHRMPPFQQDSLLNFFPARAAPGTRIQIGQIRFAINNFNQTRSHLRGGMKELGGFNNSCPVVNQGKSFRSALKIHPKECALFQQTFSCWN